MASCLWTCSKAVDMVSWPLSLKMASWPLSLKMASWPLVPGFMARPRLTVTDSTLYLGTLSHLDRYYRCTRGYYGEGVGTDGHGYGRGYLQMGQ